MASGSTGKCGVCNSIFAKSAMTNHLKSCKQRATATDASLGKRKWPPQKKRVFHIVIEGRDLPGYWMHIEAPEDAKLKDLDGFLRDIWLECCGHLSAFNIKEVSYSSSPQRDFDERSMAVKLGEVLEAGMKFSHEYDFGTTTELSQRVVSEQEDVMRGKSIRLLARNEPPRIACSSCGKDASNVCAECVWSGDGWFCEECAAEHGCGEEMLLPVVNSPRVGMCGYTGTAYGF